MSTLLVVGAGSMGAQIAQQAALHSVDVFLQDVNGEQLQKAIEQNRGHLQRRVDKGRMTQIDADAALSRVRVTTDLGEAAPLADIVIEAIVEALEPKRELFRTLNRHCRREAVLASNSSSMGISKIAAGLDGAHRCCNMHFFYPVLVMELVEVVKGPETDEATMEAAIAFSRQMGRVPVRINKEIDGFIVNRILHHASQEAYRLLDAGVATFEDIDTAIEKGLNWPMGPFRLGDFSGLDVTYAARKHIYDTTGDPRYRPSDQLKAKVEAGKLGRKTGEGWYKY